MAVLGAGEIFGGFAISHMIKKTQSHKKGILLNTMLTTIAFVTLIVYTWIFEYTYLAFVFSFFFGVIDSSTNTHCGMICGFEFEE